MNKSEKVALSFTRSNVAVLHIYYKEKTGVRYKTDIRFGVEDFVCKLNQSFPTLKIVIKALVAFNSFNFNIVIFHTVLNRKIARNSKFFKGHLK